MYAVHLFKIFAFPQTFKMSERSVVKDSWPEDIDVGGDMITHFSLKLVFPPTETCIP